MVTLLFCLLSFLAGMIAQDAYRNKVEGWD